MEFIFIYKLKLFTLQSTYSIRTKFIFLMKPFEVWRGTKPFVVHIHISRNACFVHVPKVFCKKLDVKISKGLFLGHFNESKAYQIWDFEKCAIVITRHDLFNKASFMSTTFDNSSTTNFILSPIFLQEQLFHKIYMFVLEFLELFMTSIFHKQLLLTT